MRVFVGRPVVLTKSSLDMFSSDVSDRLANEATSFVLVFGKFETEYAYDENYQLLHVGL